MQKAVLKIKNVGLVRKAEVRLDGITVITGHNNSGKTTLGKVLYSVARPVCRLGEDYERDGLLYASRRLDELLIKLQLQDIAVKDSDSAFQTFVRGGYRMIGSRSEMTIFLDQLVSEAESLSWEPAGNQEKIDNAASGLLIEREQPSIGKDGFRSAISAIKAYLDENRLPAFLGIQLLRTLDVEFRNQIDSIRDEGAKASFSIIDDDGRPLYSFSSNRGNGNSSSMSVNLDSVFSSVAFIDDPYVIDDISDKRSGYRQIPLWHRDYLRQQLSACHGETSVLEDMDNRARLETALSEIGKVLPGSYQFSQKTDYYIEGGRKYNLANLATGAKVFSVLKILLEYGQLGENGLLILDEPEAHLHPDWINRMAQLLVVLKKTLGITVVVATQSVNMVLALEAYSIQHGIHDDFALYMPDPAVEDESGMATFTEMKDSRPVYSHLTAGYEEAFHILQEAITAKGGAE